MLTEFEAVPSGLLERQANCLYEVLRGPTLVHLDGVHRDPLFVSVLLHGNEDTGWEALRTLLQRYAGRTLPRALSFFVGNVAAAREGLRRLDGQLDYNRVWSAGDSAEHAMMRRVAEAMKARNVFASIDLHNNTGFNPHYACINRLENRFLHLATLFSRTVVYFIKPDSVQSMAFSDLCPAVTVECGKPGLAHGVEHAENFIDAALHLNAFPEHRVSAHDYDLFHTVATVKVPDNVSFGFDTEDRDLVFKSDLDQLNFQELPKGTVFAAAADGKIHLDVRNEAGEDVAKRFFSAEDGELRTKVPLMPSMLTLSEKVIRQDCLCYLMERLPPLAQGGES